MFFNFNFEVPFVATSCRRRLCSHYWVNDRGWLHFEPVQLVIGEIHTFLQRHADGFDEFGLALYQVFALSSVSRYDTFDFVVTVVTRKHYRKECGIIVDRWDGNNFILIWMLNLLFYFSKIFINFIKLAKFKRIRAYRFGFTVVTTIFQ